MSPSHVEPEVRDQWILVRKEILGLQLLYRMLRGLYWDAPRPMYEHRADFPLVGRGIQTALAESVLVRLARLMDRASTTGRGNLSLERIGQGLPAVAQAIEALCAKWSGSTLSDLRNRYLSHNDLALMTSVEHTLNIPLGEDDLYTLDELINELLVLRQLVNAELRMPVYLDASVELQVRHEVEVMGRMLNGGSDD